MSVTDQLVSIAIALLKEILSRLGLFSQFATDTSTELGLIESQTAVILKSSSSQDQALAMLAAAISNINAGIAAIENTLAFQYNNPPRQSAPVRLPTVPPPGYGTATIASDVWLVPIGDDGSPAGVVLDQAGALGHNISQYVALQSQDSPLFIRYGSFDIFDDAVTGATPPHPAIANIRSTDTLLSWLAREVGGAYTLTHNVPDDGHVYLHKPAELATHWVTRWNDTEFQLLKQTLAPTPAVGATAPVWPGLASVVLGAPLALADGLTVPGPLDGVIVDITGVSHPIGYYPFGAIRSFVRAGALVFVDDNGDAEFPAPFGPDHEIVCPRQMAHADHAVLRVTSGVTGTVTPWRHV